VENIGHFRAYSSSIHDSFPVHSYRVARINSRTNLARQLQESIREFARLSHRP
jgi:hypothetical protein